MSGSMAGARGGLEHMRAAVWVLDDDDMLVELLVDLISQLDVDTYGFSDPVALLEHVEQQNEDRPRVLLCDLQMPGIDGIETARMLHARGFIHPIVLMSAFLDVERMIEAMREGFFTVVTKPIEPDALIAELDRALTSSREHYDARQDAAALQQRADLLTQREQQVVRALGQGLMNKQVADMLHLSVKTVETHRQHIMQKLSLRHAADLMRFAIEWRVSTRQRGGG